MFVLSPQITVYRLFDLADEVDLSQLDVERLRLTRGRGGAVKFERPPAKLDLGEQAADRRRGRLTARNLRVRGLRAALAGRPRGAATTPSATAATTSRCSASSGC